MSESNESKTGACLCGKIKYTVEGHALWNTGFTITDGQHFLSEYSDTMTDSGSPLTRTFCSNCGSNLFNFTPLREDIVSISAGTFDDFEDWRPDLEQYCIHRAEYLGEVKGIERRYMEKIDDVGVVGKNEPVEVKGDRAS